MPAKPAAEPLQLPLRLRVDTVEAGGSGGRLCSGRIASGQLAAGDRVRVQPAGHEARVASLCAGGAAAARAGAGEPVQLMLTGDATVAPGDLLSSADAAAEVADQFECALDWTADSPLLPGRRYRLRLLGGEAAATVTELKYRLAPGGAARVAARTLAAGETGVGNLSLDQPLPFDPWTDNPATGIGQLFAHDGGGELLAAVRLHFALRRAHNIHPQALLVGKAARAARLGQQPTVLWFTGLSGAGKSTIASLVEQRLHALGRHCALLDGDNVRHGLNRDLGFTDADRVENIRRISEVARLMVDAGLIVIVAFISPFGAERRQARERLEAGEFVEVHVDVPLALAEARDAKGLYAKARRGELRHFTGIDSPYEPPESPELRLDAARLSADEAAGRVIACLQALGRLAASNA